MKLSKIYISLAVASLLTVGGCTKSFLELDPRTSQVSETFFNKPEDAYRALIGVYSELRATRWSGSVSHMGDVLSDDAVPGGGSPTDYLDFQYMGRFTALSNQEIVGGLWAKCYTGIQRANTLLVNYDKITFKPAEADIQKQYKAEALALRAHFYYELLRFYENVPLILEPIAGNAWREVVQAAPADVYAQVAKDFKDAIPNMANAHGANSLGRLTQWGAKAELLKVFMFYTGFYQQATLPVAGGSPMTKADAIALAKDIIDNSGAVLESDYAKLFTSAGDYNAEILFEIPFADTQSGDWDGSFLGNYGVQQAGPRGHESNLMRAGWGFFLPTQELSESFAANDPRRGVAIIDAKDLIDAGGLSPSYTHTGMYHYKYGTRFDRNPSGGSYELNWGNSYHYIRLADVKLLYAELLLGTNDAEALAQVNQVRARVQLPALASVNLDVIYQERRTELALEGHRYWDVLRRGLTYAKEQLDVVNYVKRGPKATGNKYLSKDGDNMTGDIGTPADFAVNFDLAKRGFLPIPQSEIDLNSKIKQNPGY